MVQRQEFSMQVEARIPATLRQPMKLKSSLAFQAWEPSVHTPCNEKCKRRQVMHRVHQPSMHSEVCFASCVVCPDPIVPGFFQVIHQRLQVHIHIFARIVGPRNYQRQEDVLSLHKDSRGQIEGHDEYGPTTILGCGHTERIEPIEANGDCHVSWVFGFTFFMYFIEHLPRFTIRGVGQHQIPYSSVACLIPSLCHVICFAVSSSM